MSARHEIPEALRSKSLPELLLGYQAKLLKTTALSPVTICEKSRRIGVTWGIAADAVLTAAAAKAAGGMDVLYLGYNLDMAREFVDVAATFARQFARVAAEVNEFLFDDGSEKGIAAFRIRFDSGFEIVALASRPRSLRGRQGYVIIDEAAFHDDLEEVMKAALALLIWGGKILVISTHDGEENYFNQLVQDARSGKKPYAVSRITFDDALKDGLYRRICLVKGIEWTAEGEAKWRNEIYAFYGDAAAEELDVVPSKGSGAFIPRALVEARADPAVPVLRLKLDVEFTKQPDHARVAHVDAWCKQHLAPLLDKLDPNLPSYLGEDFGRTIDRSAFWPAQLGKDMVLRAPFVLELLNVPFEQQRQILFFILDRLPRFSGAALDATGNGAYLAEVAQLTYGSDVVEAVKLSDAWYLANMPKLKARFQDATMTVPRDQDVINDFADLKLVKGIAKIADGTKRTGTDGTPRHGDAAIAAAMLCYAATKTPIAYGYERVPTKRPFDEGAPDSDRMRLRPNHDADLPRPERGAF